MSTQIKLTGEELMILADMAYLAMMVAEPIRDEGREREFNAWGTVCDKVLAELEKNPKFSSRVQFSPDGRNYYLTKEYLDHSFLGDCVNEYRDNVFWDDLVTRMADMSLLHFLGSQKFEAMTEEEKRAMSEPYEKALWEECARHGIDRFGFVLPPREV